LGEDKRWDMADAGAQISLEVIARISRMPKYANITPIVVLSSWEKERNSRFREAGASEVMNMREVEPSEFASRMMRHIKRV